MWTEWGVRDAGHLVHSLGCTLLTAVGRDLGFAAVSEVPAPRQGILANVDQDVRSDSVWFDRSTRHVALVAEFERYSGKQKDLSPKVETLLLAQQRWECPNATLLLAYWSVGLVTLPDHDVLRSIVRGGFHAAGACASLAIRPRGSSSASSLFAPGRMACSGSRTSFDEANHDDQVLRATSRPAPRRSLRVGRVPRRWLVRLGVARATPVRRRHRRGEDSEGAGQAERGSRRGFAAGWAGVAPCVVDVYWMGRVPPEREWYAIEMEYFPSITLAQLLDKGEEGFVASYDKLLGVFEQVLEGCAHLHRVGCPTVTSSRRTSWSPPTA
jgi:hypothetical protein